MSEADMTACFRDPDGYFALFVVAVVATQSAWAHSKSRTLHQLRAEYLARVQTQTASCTGGTLGSLYNPSRSICGYELRLQGASGRRCRHTRRA